MANSFHGVIAFAMLAALLVLGATLRRKIGWLQRSLVPSSIIGGAIGLVLLSLGALPGYGPSDFTALTFHFFTLGFMSLCLTGSGKGEKKQGRSLIVGGLWLTLIWTVSLGGQGIIGYGLIEAYNSILSQDVSPMLGAMSTHGFTQGPGQALTYGTLWEKNFGLEHAIQVGIIYASLGFLVAFALGVPLAKWVIRQRIARGEINKSQLSQSFLNGFYGTQERPESGRMVTHPANLDSMAWHLGLLGIAYVLTHLWLMATRDFAASLELGGIQLGVLFDHNVFFMHGLVICTLLRRLMDYCGLGNLIDDGTMQTITSGSVDIMVVGSLMSVQFAVLKTLFVPIVLVTVVISIFTLVLCVGVSRLSGTHAYERAVTIFGCCCGSTGSGLLLLRILDPEFTTPVARELAFYNIAITVVNFHLLYLFAPVAPSLGSWTYLLAFGGTAALALLSIPFLLRLSRPHALA